MTAKEKRLLRIFLGLAALVIVLQGGSILYDQYFSGRDDIDALYVKIERLERLQERSEFWQKKHALALKTQERLSAQLAKGATPELVGAQVQRLLKQYAREAGVQVDSMSVPEFSRSGRWLLVNQSMTFKAGSGNLMQLLKQISEANPRLEVMTLDVRVARQNRLNGTLRVVGFSRLEDQAARSRGKRSRGV